MSLAYVISLIAPDVLLAAHINDNRGDASKIENEMAANGVLIASAVEARPFMDKDVKCNLPWIFFEAMLPQIIRGKDWPFLSAVGSRKLKVFPNDTAIDPFLDKPITGLARVVRVVASDLGLPIPVSDRRVARSNGMLEPGLVWLERTDANRLPQADFSRIGARATWSRAGQA